MKPNSGARIEAVSGAHVTNWYREAVEECVVVMGDERVLPFASWEDAVAYYRERARLLDEGVGSARFFLCKDGQWTRVERPEFAN